MQGEYLGFLLHCHTPLAQFGFDVIRYVREYELGCEKSLHDEVFVYWPLNPLKCFVVTGRYSQPPSVNCSALRDSSCAPPRMTRANGPYFKSE
jgi:hypothetical protein